VSQCLNEESTQVVVRCFGVAVNDIELAFLDVRASVVAGKTPSLQQLQQLLRYVDKQWLKICRWCCVCSNSSTRHLTVFIH